MTMIGDAYDEALARVDNPEWSFLAGLMTGRGTMYIGRSKRGNSERFSPGIAVEVPLTLDLLRETMDGPVERKYYGKVAYRYYLQDRSKIVRFLAYLAPHLTITHANRALALGRFCSDPSEANYNVFVSTP